jgi:branched-chain amino acid transport system substrate-binding protein
MTIELSRLGDYTVHERASHVPLVVTRSRSSMRMHRLLAGGLRALITIAASACVLFPGIANAATVKVGVVLPLTGGYAGTGTEERRGIELAVERINKAGGIKSLGGATIEAVFADDQGDSKLASSEAERLITQQGVKLMVGPPSSGETLAASVVAERHRIPFLNVISWADELYQRGLKYFFGLPGKASTMAEFMVDGLDQLIKTQQFQPGRIVVLSNGTPFAEAVTGPLNDQLKARGFNVVGYVKYDAKAADLTPVVMKLKGLNAQTIMGISHEPDGLRLQRARKEQDFAPNIIAGISGYAQPSIRKDLGAAGVSQFLSAGVFVLNLASADMNTPGWRPAVQAAKAKWGAEYAPNPLGFGSAYQGMLILKEALEAAGSLDGQAIRQAFLNLRIKKGSELQVSPFKTDLTFDETGFSKGLGFVLVQFPAIDKEVTVYPPELATAQPVLRKK